MSVSWLAALRPNLDALCIEWKLPGIVVAAQRAGEPLATLAFGHDAADRPLRANSLLPVASVTKLATTLALLRLVADGRADLDAPLADALPDALMAQPGVTWRTMLSHSAGAAVNVVDALAPYTAELTWPVLASAALQTPPLFAPHRQLLYSNVSFGLAAHFIERVTTLPFPTALQELVLQPLGVRAWLGEEPPLPPAVVSGGKSRHMASPLEPINSAFWRSLALPWGGLITTAAGALALVQAFDSEQPAPLLPVTLLRDATGNQTGALGGGFTGWLEWTPCAWGLGVELRGAKRGHYAGARASAASWGHVGGTGCLAWSDPQAALSWFVFSPRTVYGWGDGMGAVSDLLLGASG